MKTVLVVDDNKCIRDALTITLASFLPDCAIINAANGAEAAEIFDSSAVDAVITDLSMPIMDGYQLMKHVREKSSLVPLIVISAECFPDQDEKIKPFRVVRCFRKPFPLHDIVREVASLFGLAQPAATGRIAVPDDVAMAGHEYARAGLHHS